MPAQKVYHDITHAKFAAVREAAAGWGIDINATHGTAKTVGCKFSWEWLKTKKTLKIEILDGGMWGEDAALLFVDGLLQSVLSAVPIELHS
jgi:hypothetical protein